MSKKIVVANWKMNFPGLGPWRGFRPPKNVEVVICPPFPYLSDIRHRISDIGHPKSDIRLGAQDVFWERSGPYTGEVSPEMLKNSGASYVIVGHSERRRWLHETDKMINKKIKAALGAGLKAILCVGEPLAVRRKGVKAVENFVKDQLAKDLGSLHSKSHILNSRLIVAYEPVWAIGTGRSDKPSDALLMAKFIKNILHSKVLYGGSVNGKGARSFLQYKEIDGALVGGASLKAGEFKKIVKISSNA